MTRTRTFAPAALALVLSVACIDAALGAITLCARPSGQVYMVGEGFPRAACSGGDTPVNVSPALVARTGEHTFFFSTGRLDPGVIVSKAWTAPAGSYFVIARVRFSMFGSALGNTIMRCDVSGSAKGPTDFVDFQEFSISPDRIDPPPPPNTTPQFLPHRQMILTGPLAPAGGADVEVEIACHAPAGSLGDTDVEVLSVQMFPISGVEPLTPVP